MHILTGMSSEDWEAT